jgi:nitrous oxidase accessory protein
MSAGWPRTRRTERRTVAAIVALMLLAFWSATPATQHAVSPGGASENTIQRAIDAASPGDTILVSGGVYVGNLLIHARLAVIGVDRPVIRGSGKGSVVTVTADSCVLDGFVIEHSGSMLVNEDAGVLLKSARSVVRNNELRDVLFGVYLMHAERNLVRDNSITGRRQLELGERGSGIHIWNSEHNQFTGNRITDVRDGFYIQNASHSWIESNEAYGVRYGLHYMYADSNTFLGNSFHDNVAGAAVMYSRGIVMRNNVFAHNRGFSSFGILFQDCHGLRADSNVVTDNVIGMFFEASTDNTFLHNVVAQNDIALEIFQNSTNNAFLENNFIDNINPLAIVGKRTGSRWSVGGRGNYWSGYDGYDLDGDGIGDIPMRIQNVFQYIEGQNANVRVYLYSSASQALAVASKAFPIININEESDERPLMQPFDMSMLPAVRMASRQSEGTASGGGHEAEAWITAPLLLLAAMGFLTHRLNRRTA